MKKHGSVCHSCVLIVKSPTKDIIVTDGNEGIGRSCRAQEAYCVQYEPSDHSFDGLDIISTMNDSRSSIAEMKSKLSDALHHPTAQIVHNMVPHFGTWCVVLHANAQHMCCALYGIYPGLFQPFILFFSLSTFTCEKSG